MKGEDDFCFMPGTWRIERPLFRAGRWRGHRKKPRERRMERICVALTMDEMDRLTRRALKKGLRVSELVRRRAIPCR